MIFTSDPNLQIVRNGLQVWYDILFQTSYPASGTTIFDLSGNSNNGVLINGVGYSSADGGTLTFDGVNDYANCGTVSQLTGIYDVSVSIWVKAISNVGANANAIISRYYNTNSYNGWAILGGAAAEPFSFGFGGRENLAGSFLFCSTSSNYYYLQWYQITGVKAANLWSIYVNGNLENSQTLGLGNISFLDNVIYLADFPQFGDPPNRNNNLNIAQIQIYNRALSAAEVAHNYKVTKGRFT